MAKVYIAFARTVFIALSICCCDVIVQLRGTILKNPSFCFIISRSPIFLPCVVIITLSTELICLKRRSPFRVVLL